MDLSKHEGIEGKISLTIPPYKMRLKMIKECNFKADDKGEISAGMDSIDSIIRLIELTSEYFHEVNLTCGEIKALNFNDMEENPEFDQLLTDSASAILQAGKLGE